ncbi:CubicO group peptidase, beta-lactamase class C family [Gillisia sp. Hel1_33_143]|uniref:serine hydrolase domain-containing protein n=1 Tax=Gillisia sp. Hel1_33_143 TaxID=1336796 RepID=UPI00087C1372|nr:serine hydrolase domain-containing protein [Gillisia sp. Hel1_33_143]SDS02636.1 CubicO group peptidase, beta-lactamase class C family [Gillisia sp. Hel1_33_143]
MKRLFVLVSFLLIGFSTIAQELNTAKLDSLFSLISLKDKAMGSFSIFQDGEEIYKHSIGFEDISKNEPASHLTRYRIGSVSKTFTAVLFLKLVEEGKVGLETTLDNFYPEIPNAQNITMEFLLDHHSGLFNYTSQDSYIKLMESPRSKEEMLQLFIKNGTIFSPGSRFQYSNTNYALLTFIIEDLEKQNFATVLKERITKPLGLKNTYFGGKIISANNEAFSYKKRRAWMLETETDMSNALGAGGLVSTPTEINTFFTALFNNKVLKAETLEQMIALKDRYGLGISRIRLEDKEGFGHSGGIDGFSAIGYYFPEEKLAYSFVLNGLDMNSSELIKGPLSIYFHKDYSLPVFEMEYRTDLSDLQSYEGTYASPMLPIKLDVFIEDGSLLVQGTNQPAFILYAVDKDKFKNDLLKLKIEFKPSESKLILSQGGGIFELTKEKEVIATE